VIHHDKTQETPMLKRLTRLTFAAAALFGAAAAPAFAAYPDKPIRFVLPFPAGSSTDAVARVLATHLGAELKTTVIVDSVPGAGGTLATARVAKSDPDGYTVLFTTTNHAINPALYPKLPFDTEKDLLPVTQVAETPELLIAHRDVPFNDFAGFVQYARAHPGKLNYASAGNGTLPHVTMELLLQKLKLKVTHIPYRGAAPALNDLLGGQVAVKMDTIVSSQPHIASGRVKPLALAALKRSPLLPGVPTVAESGLPGYQGILWLGLLVPAQTPPEVVTRLHQAVLTALKVPELQRRFAADGVISVGSSPAEFGRRIHEEIQQWNELVREQRITPD
jgi:tripartite-type tricarboxylate transporter receptor subunit TctC